MDNPKIDGMRRGLTEAKAPFGIGVNAAESFLVDAVNEKRDQILNANMDWAGSRLVLRLRTEDGDREREARYEVKLRLISAD